MKKYWPLVVVVLFSILGGLFLLHAQQERSFMTWMVNFSGFFFLYLATFKFWDLKGFATGFGLYDLLAKKTPSYGFIYPFLELLIAFCFLAHFFLVGIALFTMILMAFSLLGVINALLKKESLKCACMGTKLDLPLTSVSVVENLGMGVMAFFIAKYFF